MNIIVRLSYKLIPSENGKINAIMIASISVGMSFRVSPCERVIRSLIMKLGAESN